jgi:TonB family protein
VPCAILSFQCAKVIWMILLRCPVVVVTLLGVAQTCVAQPGADGTASTSANPAPLAPDGGSTIPPKEMPDTTYACEYPVNAIKASQRGTTVLRTIIDTRGVPAETSVVSSSGSHQLDAAAVECFGKKRFRPALRDRKPVRYQMEQRTNWDLRPLPQTCEGRDPPKTKRSADERASVTGDTVTTTPPSMNEAIVCVCFSESGNLLEPTIVQSSGDPRIDQGAIEVGKLSHFGGQAGCRNLRVNFKDSSR